MKHDATRNPGHAITLKKGDRLKARVNSHGLNEGCLYEVLAFRDLDFPDNDKSTTRLLDVNGGTRLSVNNNALQSLFKSGGWALA